MGSKGSLLVRARRLRDSLLEPSPVLRDPGERRRARWLAGLLFLMVCAFGSLDAFYAVTRPGYTPPWFGYLWLGAAYALVRRGLYTAGALLTLAMFPIVAFAMVVLGRSASPGTTLSFLVLGIVLSSVLVSVGVVALFTVAALLGMGVLHVFAERLGIASEALIGPAVLVAITGGIASVGAMLRLRVERDRQEDLLLANSELERRVRERTAELERANRELEAFAYSASHDLRTPLRAIDAYAAMLIEDEGARLGDGARRSLDRIRSSTLRMTELVDSMLELSRVSRGELRVERLDLSALAHEIMDELRASEPQRAVEFACGAGCSGYGDRALVRIALFNLLENAWKFTSKQASARIELGASNGGGAYFVKDNGVGFEPELADKLFRPFQRLHRADEFSGSGIGAALVARVVERHGGRVWAEARPGAGATFYFTLADPPAGPR